MARANKWTHTIEKNRFRHVEAWSMRELGFSDREVAEELGVGAHSVYNMITKAKQRGWVPPSDNYCEFVDPASGVVLLPEDYELGASAPPTRNPGEKE